SEVPSPVEGKKVPSNGGRESLDEMPHATALLESAERPLILVGGGAIWSGCGPEIISLAETIMSPVATTLMGKSAVPEDHPLVLGMVGMHGRRVANYALEECDVLLAIGTRFSDRMIGEPASCRTKVIHVDIDSGEMGKNVRPTVSLVGDAGKVVRSILSSIGMKRAGGEWPERMRLLKARCACDTDLPDNPIKPQKVIHDLSKYLPDDAIITTEVGQCQMFAAHHFECRGKRTFITPGGLGTMGFGLPAAIGAKVAAPDRAVVDVAGDGSLLMVCQEMATAVEENVPVFICLLNNGRLGMIKQLQTMFYGRRLFAESLGSSPDFVKLAEAFGVRAVRVQDPRDLASVIEEGAQSGRAFLADVWIDRDEEILPVTLRTEGGTKVIAGNCVWKGVC
ncbi:MAG: acetolactate synthase, large subunit, biosynthetic type, partial [Euryarchaeota archaeon]|nr:acetolactate synthase, large subunit, biosynthetic type [Euryarchaeota archaeon]